MNLPNKLSLLRVCMIPLFVVFATMTPYWAQFVAAALFGAASFTDFLDGYIARKRHLVTNFGKFVDPIADKLLVMSAYVTFVGQGRMPAWVCILLLARELAISGFRLVAVTAGNVIAAGILGKIKTVTQIVSILMMLLFIPTETPGFIASLSPMLSNVLEILAYVALGVATFMTVLSGADYIIKNFDCIKDM